MKKKIKCLYIDGVEKSGKTSVIREMRKFLKNKNKDLHEINGADLEKIKQQELMIQDSDSSFVLQENSMLSLIYKDLKENKALISNVEEFHPEIIRKERHINQKYGSVHFFLIPETKEALDRMYGSEEKPSYINDLLSIYKNINLYSVTQGLDIRLIFFDEFDRIYDIRDKILKILENDYNI